MPAFSGVWVAAGALAARASRYAAFRLAQPALCRAGVAHARAIPTWTTPGELVVLYRLAAACRPHALCLEIGSYLGASTCFLAAGLRPAGGRLVCVDTWQNETMPEGERDTFAEFERNTRSVREQLTLIRKRSDELAAAEIPDPLELAFLDGDHTYEAVRRDFGLVSTRISQTGVVAFHDAQQYHGVSRVIGEALATGEWMVAGQTENLLWISRPTWSG